MRLVQPAIGVALALAAALLLGRGAPAPEALAQGEAVAVAETPVAVQIVNFAYAPEVLTVAVGTSVRWTNDDTAQHDVVADNRSFGSLLLSKGQSYQTTFDQPGRFGYFCSLHPGMSGTVVVEEGPAQGQSSVYLPLIRVAGGAAEAAP